LPVEIYDTSHRVVFRCSDAMEEMLLWSYQNKAAKKANGLGKGKGKKSSKEA